MRTAKMAIGLAHQKNNLPRAARFLYISLPSLVLYEDVSTSQQFSLSELRYSPSHMLSALSIHKSTTNGKEDGVCMSQEMCAWKIPVAIRKINFSHKFVRIVSPNLWTQQSLPLTYKLKRQCQLLSKFPSGKHFSWHANAKPPRLLRRFLLGPRFHSVFKSGWRLGEEMTDRFFERPAWLKKGLNIRLRRL